MTPVRLEPVASQSRVKHSTTALPTHSCVCTKAKEQCMKGEDPIRVKMEMNRSGLFSVLMAVCQGCSKQFPLNTSPKQDNGIHINFRAVWGTVLSGDGPSDLNEMLSTMDAPCMSETMFTTLEDEIGTWWQSVLEEELLQAGAEERGIAIESGQHHEGIPAITVICDGGWSKHSHKYTYNAYGGVGVIFGAETQKLLHIGVRNKYCVFCRRAEYK